MPAQVSPTTDSIPFALASRPTGWRVGLMAAAMLFGLGLLQTLAIGNAALPFGERLLANLIYYPPWWFYAVILFVLLDRDRDRVSQPMTLLRAFGFSLLGFYLPYSGYSLLIASGGQALTVAGLQAAWSRWLGYSMFTDFVLFCGAFGAICGGVLWRGQRDRDRRNAQLQAHMLTMQLQLEQQRLAAIQAQLEPHFLFNALTAISALVRAGDQVAALQGIARLSDLLRYALEASRRDWVALSDELGFLSDYLKLQRLRHGDRLQVQVDADPVALADIVCPPLLLQPLVENALRHDLDTHAGASDIRLRIRSTGERVQITLSNAVSANAASNPGLGLGLRNTRELLALRYGDQATMQTESGDDRFTVMLTLPEGPER